MKNKIKVRMRTWYWGNFAIVGEMMDNSRVTLNNPDFEYYYESQHGWHLSDEHKKGHLPFNREALVNFLEVQNANT